MTRVRASGGSAERTRPYDPFSGYYDEMHEHGSAIAWGFVHMSDKPRVLVVDDDRAIRVLVAKIVERAGFPVDTASDGAEAIEKIRATCYAVCVIDLMMPNVNGYEIVEFIGEHCSAGARPAVIVITAVAESSAIVRLDGRIVHSVVRKPFDISVLGELITATATTMAEQSGEKSGEDDGERTVLPFPQTR